jgi:hypothetical protein
LRLSIRTNGGLTLAENSGQEQSQEPWLKRTTFQERKKSMESIAYEIQWKRWRKNETDVERVCLEDSRRERERERERERGRERLSLLHFLFGIQWQELDPPSSTTRLLL